MPWTPASRATRATRSSFCACSVMVWVTDTSFLSPARRRRAFLRESLLRAIETIRRDAAVDHQDAVPERRGLSGLQRGVQRLLAVAERLLPQRIRREQAVAARVPVGGIARIARMIEDGDADGRVADFSAQHAPAAARAPGVVSFLAFAGQVLAGD